MSEGRMFVLLFLLAVSALDLAGTGATIWHAGGHPPSLAYDYGLSAVALLGWLAYFGSRV